MTFDRLRKASYRAMACLPAASVAVSLILLAPIGNTPQAGEDESGKHECPAGQREYEGDCITDPVPIKKQAPKYPRKAREYRVEARVTLEAIITREGKVIKPEVKDCTSPGWKFEEAALKAVRGWRYEPARVNGEIKSVYFTIIVDFKMR